ncbi:MAG: GNAT family N-acetyltransferase [Bradymonadia bacterium]
MESEEAEQTLEAEIEEPEGSIDVSIHELLPIPVAHEAPKLDELEAGVRHRVDRVRQLTDADHQALRAFLLRDRMMAAYQLGDLDDPFIEHTRWFGVDSPEEGLTGVLLWYSGLSMPAILPMGSPDDVMALLARARTLLPRKIFASHPLTHTDAFAQYYRPITVKPVLRMSLQRSDWRPQPSEPAPNETIEKLTHRDTAAIMQLYRYYPDNFFEPAQLDTGMYFGVKQAGELVSVAGIHVLSDAQDIAVVGNMVTHAGKRGQGLATKSVSRVLQAIFERVGYVALNVAEDNASAIACYRKFGFEVHCRLQEGWMERL